MIINEVRTYVSFGRAYRSRVSEIRRNRRINCGGVDRENNKRKLSNTICSIIRVPNVKCELFVEYFERVENSQEFFIMKTLLTHEEFYLWRIRAETSKFARKVFDINKVLISDMSKKTSEIRELVCINMRLRQNVLRTLRVSESRRIM